VSIKQFNATWSPLEDRIELNINTDEDELYRFWLTRLISQKIIDHCRDLSKKSLEKQHGERLSEVLHEFQKESFKSSVNFKSSFQGGEILPLGPEAVLITDVQISPSDQLVSLQFNLGDGKNIQFLLHINQLNILTLLIERISKGANWNLVIERSNITNVQQSSNKFH